MERLGEHLEHNRARGGWAIPTRTTSRSSRKGIRLITTVWPPVGFSPRKKTATTRWARSTSGDGRLEKPPLTFAEAGYRQPPWPRTMTCRASPIPVRTARSGISSATPPHEAQRHPQLPARDRTLAHRVTLGTATHEREEARTNTNFSRSPRRRRIREAGQPASRRSASTAACTGTPPRGSQDREPGASAGMPPGTTPLCTDPGSRNRSTGRA